MFQQMSGNLCDYMGGYWECKVQYTPFTSFQPLPSCPRRVAALSLHTMNGTIWWLILTVTWLLAAGFKWGSEAIEKHHLYYHGLAWGIPAVQTMIVVTTGKIEGDNIAGDWGVNTTQYELIYTVLWV